jgi:hypothetical protein
MKLVPKGALAAGAKVTEDLPTENVIFDYLKKLGSQPSGSNALKAAALGGGSLGALSAHLGMDEGMQADVIDDERRALLKKKLGV